MRAIRERAPNNRGRNTTNHSKLLVSLCSFCYCYIPSFFPSLSFLFFLFHSLYSFPSWLSFNVVGAAVKWEFCQQQQQSSVHSLVSDDDRAWTVRLPSHRLYPPLLFSCEKDLWASSSRILPVLCSLTLWHSTCWHPIRRSRKRGREGRSKECVWLARSLQFLWLPTPYAAMHSEALIELAHRGLRLRKNFWRVSMTLCNTIHSSLSFLRNSPVRTFSTLLLRNHQATCYQMFWLFIAPFSLKLPFWPIKKQK